MVSESEPDRPDRHRSTVCDAGPLPPIGGRESGGLLVEVGIAAGILLMLLGVVVSIMTTGLSAQVAGSAIADLSDTAQRSVDRVARELRMSGSSVISPVPSSGTTVVTALTYQPSAGSVDGSASWGPTRRLELRPDPTDADDGIDNNGNGIIDEKILVLVTDVGSPDEYSMILVRWVRERLVGEEANGKDDNGNGLIDEAGFCCTLKAAVWTIRISLEKPSSQGALYAETAETSVTPWN